MCLSLPHSEGDARTRGRCHKMKQKPERRRGEATRDEERPRRGQARRPREMRGGGGRSNFCTSLVQSSDNFWTHKFLGTKSVREHSSRLWVFLQKLLHFALLQRIPHWLSTVTPRFDLAQFSNCFLRLAFMRRAICLTISLVWGCNI